MAWSMRRALTGGSILVAGVAGLAVVTAAQALEPGTTAAYEVLDCADFDGSIRMTLTVDAAEPGSVEFMMMEDREFWLTEPDHDFAWTVAPGETREVVIDGLADGPRTIEVVAWPFTGSGGEDPVGEEPGDTEPGGTEQGDGEAVIVLPEESYEIACDAIPTEPYTNAMAVLTPGCRDFPGSVWAINRPIREQVDLLIPVEFVVIATDPSGAAVELDRFTLPSPESEDPYSYNADYPLLDGAVGPYPVEVTIDAQVVASDVTDPACEAVPELHPGGPASEGGGPSLNGGGGHPQLPATGY